MPDKTRVGLIRCDSHGLWYAALMAQVDPLLLKNPRPYDPDIKYSWEGGGVHRFFYTNYGDPTLRTAPYVGGFEITRVWDVHPEVAEETSRVLCDRPMVCDTPDQCSDDVDLVFIADCNWDGEDHVELATPGLEKGVPTFIDKPLAFTVGECRQLIELAARKKAPLFSASILRFEPTVARFRNRIPEVGQLNFATLNGAGTAPAGLIHTISATQHLFGTGVSTVEVMSTAKQTSVWLDYDNNPRAPANGVMIHADTGTRCFPGAIGISLIGTEDDIDLRNLGSHQYPWGAAEIVRRIQQMLVTGKNPAELDDMVEGIATLEAFRAAQATGKPARVADFL
ncbi:MAG: Gfo/Idh/MocA family oxidoreductase [Pirellulales bacterium]|jgi:predicted dehydrogenase|nr:Gfo/Idh/MocA family oxidoreductase [Pirellulales bacterium]